MKINYKKGEENTERVVNKLYERLFKKWYSGNDEIFITAIVHEVPNGTDRIKTLIKNLLIKGADVRTGYTSSSIRGYRNYHIFETGFHD